MRLIIRIFLVVFITTSISSCSIKTAATKSTEKKELVYLLHGLGRGSGSMWYLALKLRNSGYTVKRVGYPSINRTPKEIIDIIDQEIDEKESDKFKKVHFVGHSLGGLMIREYLSKKKVSNLGRVVMLGTPNHGTTVVDKYKDKWFFKILGKMTLALGTDKSSFPNSLPSPYYPVGIIAGFTDKLYNEFVLPGEDDGVVPLKSTKLTGMKDMIIIKTGHAMMKYDSDVAIQTIAFLQTGSFNRSLSKKYKIYGNL
ncbi:MAG: alpha/beta fold hydrolase [Desulfobacterales bacterium]|nr:alpha/beta fold hydrolase [Desulfobacterales bacterium]MCP4163192.1 alpha/beta fold hydrolase [Deltaproteobacteria bacterium]